MKTKIVISSLLLSISLFITAQTVEVKGSITFKTIQQENGVKDTLVSKGARALITLFNKKDSKMVSIAEDNGDYFFDLDTIATPYTHIEFLNMEGGYVTFSIKDIIKQPFFDVVIINEENLQTTKSNKNKQKQTTVNPQPIVQPTTPIIPPTEEKVEVPAPLPKENIVEPAVIEPPKEIEAPKEIETPKAIEPLKASNETKLDVNQFLPEEAVEEVIDPETEKLNREIKELEDALKKANAEK